MKGKSILLPALAAGIVLSLATPSVSQDETFEWRMQSLHPAGTPGYEIFRDYFAPMVEKMSNGRLIIKPFASDAIIKNREVLDAVANGTFEGGQQSPAYWTGKDPAFVFIRNASAGFDQAWQYNSWLTQGGGLELAQDVYKDQGVHLIGLTLRPGEPLHFSTPIRSLEEFRAAGPKVRTIPGIPSDVFAAMGGSPVHISGSEVYSAMDKGIIDVGEWTGLADNYSVGLHEVSEAFLYPAFHSPVGVDDVFVSQAAWDALPDDLKAIVAVAVANWSQYQWEKMVLEDREALVKFLEAGDEHISWSEKDMVDVRTMAKDSWAVWGDKTPAAKKIYESQIGFMEELGLL